MLKNLFPSKQKTRHGGSRPDRQYALACIPVRNPECTEDWHDEGLLLRYPVQAKPWLRKMFTATTGRKPDVVFRKLQLDTLGTGVWRMIDGNTSVRHISRNFQLQHQLDQREAEIAVSTFIQQLGKRGLVALKKPKKE